MKSILGWNEALNPEELPPYLSQRDYGNPKLVVFKKNGRFSTLIPSRCAFCKANAGFASYYLSI
jgi:hypothetical protein